jgi:hypothetical protein
MNTTDLSRTVVFGPAWLAQAVREPEAPEPVPGMSRDDMIQRVPQWFALA